MCVIFFVAKPCRHFASRLCVGQDATHHSVFPV